MEVDLIEARHRVVALIGPDEEPDDESTHQLKHDDDCWKPQKIGNGKDQGTLCFFIGSVENVARLVPKNDLSPNVYGAEDKRKGAAFDKMTHRLNQDQIRKLSLLLVHSPALNLGLLPP